MLQSKGEYHSLNPHEKFERTLFLVQFLCHSRRVSGEEIKGNSITSGLFLLSLYPANDTSMFFIGFYEFCSREEFMHLGA